MNKQSLKINIRIEEEGNGTTLMLLHNFDDAIMSLINEREWYNFDSKERLKEHMKKADIKLRKKLKEKKA